MNDEIMHSLSVDQNHFDVLFLIKQHSELLISQEFLIGQFVHLQLQSSIVTVLSPGYMLSIRLCYLQAIDAFLWGKF